MKRVLIIAYNFPPILSGGVFRPLKFAKYLTEQGWDAIVLTTKNLPQTFKDWELYKDIPKNINVHRSFSAHPKFFLLFLKKILRMGKGNEKNFTELKYTKKINLMTRLINRVSSLIINFGQLFIIPDESILWVPFALMTAIKILGKNKVDIIFTTSPPESSHILGFLLKKIYNIPWVVDFRDLWTHNIAYWKKDKYYYYVKINKYLERKIIEKCDAIINIGYGERELLLKMYKDVSSSKFHVITNGYDPKDFIFDNISSNLSYKKNKLLLSHVGTLYPTLADEYFDAIEELLNSNIQMREIIEFRFIGFIFPEYEKRIRECKYKENFVSTGVVKFNQSIKYMMESDVLVILLGGNSLDKSEIPGKIFMYLATKKPILAIAREGDSAEIIRRSGLGKVIYPTNKSEIKSIIERWCQDKNTNNILRNTPNNKYIMRYSYPVLTKKLDKLLSQIIQQ